LLTHSFFFRSFFFPSGGGEDDPLRVVFFFALSGLSLIFCRFPFPKVKKKVLAPGSVVAWLGRGDEWKKELFLIFSFPIFLLLLHSRFIRKKNEGREKKKKVKGRGAVNVLFFCEGVGLIVVNTKNWWQTHHPPPFVTCQTFAQS
jgi:membrane-bound acyltransferase YfiQ involved in biofilm formation